jgi:LysR family transcriptional regulator, carnitine catabolism transcriptional activator
MIHDVRHIKAFLAAARIGNFTRAAQELHLSQSAFTVQIRQLEDSLGITLFDRGKRGTTLTAAGRDVLIPLERILVDIESVVARTQKISSLRRGMVSIAVLPSVAVNFLPGIIRSFTDDHPGIDVQIHDVVAERLIEAVKKEMADFGIGSPMQTDRELVFTPLMADRLYAFVPADHALARQRSVTVRELAQLPLIVTGRDSSVRERFERALRRERLTAKIAYETNYISTAVSLAKAGLGVAILPESAAGDDSSVLRSLPIGKPQLGRKIVLIQRKDRTLSPAASEMVSVIRKACEGSKLKQ